MAIFFFLKKVENAECPEDLENLRSDSSELLQAAGWDKLLTYDNRVAAMQLVAAHEAFYIRKLSIDQFCKGLEVLGVLDLIRGHPDLMEPYFVHTAVCILTPAVLFNQFLNIEKEEDGLREVMRQHLKRCISECFEGKSCHFGLIAIK